MERTILTTLRTISNLQDEMLRVNRFTTQELATLRELYATLESGLGYDDGGGGGGHTIDTTMTLSSINRPPPSTGNTATARDSGTSADTSGGLSGFTSGSAATTGRTGETYLISSAATGCDSVSVGNENSIAGNITGGGSNTTRGGSERSPGITLELDHPPYDLIPPPPPPPPPSPSPISSSMPTPTPTTTTTNTFRTFSPRYGAGAGNAGVTTGMTGPGSPNSSSGNNIPTFSNTKATTTNASRLLGSNESILLDQRDCCPYCARLIHFQVTSTMQAPVAGFPCIRGSSEAVIRFRVKVLALRQALEDATFTLSGSSGTGTTTGTGTGIINSNSSQSQDAPPGFATSTPDNSGCIPSER